MARFIKSFEQVGIGDIALVGGKNASLGEMTRQLQKKGIRVPGGFAITADAYVHLLKNGGIFEQLQKALDGLDTGDTELLSVRANQARSIIKQAGLPEDLRSEIVDAYRQLEKHYGQNCDVAVRS
ncbi:MAG: phosphoenolpyruvate synthase, partial [Cyanobacteria bacterium]|nr:phosphoenolpyruvate synthase [Cyanobacteriota bacterium]